MSRISLPRSGAVAVVAVVVLTSLAGCTGGVAPAAVANGTTATAPAGETTAAVANGTTATPGGSSANGTLSVHFIHVGQGTSVLVVGPTGETLLYDTGNWRDDGEHVLDYLRAHNVTRIDSLVTSHADADHVGGHAAVIDHYETEAGGVGAIYDPGIAAATRTYEEYLDAVEEHNVTLYRSQAGDSIPLAGAAVEVLAPPEGSLAGRDRNENSLVLRVEYGNVSFLLPGDAEGRAERYLTETYGPALNVTVLAAGHHGSNTSTGPGLLTETSPRAVVVQSAYDSPYGHPHRELLARLADRGIPTYWTGVHGTVVFETGGERVAVRTQRAAPTDPLDLRSAPGVRPSADDPLEREETFVAGRVRTDSSSKTVAPDGGRVSNANTTSEGQRTSGSRVSNANTTSEDQRSSGSRASNASALAVAEVHADAQGDESENLNDEYVVLRNEGNRSLDLSGWSVADAAGHVYTVPAGTALAPGETLTLHTGSGTDGGGHRYWGSERPIWNNAGDTILVRTDDGALVLEVEYDG